MNIEGDLQEVGFCASGAGYEIAPLLPHATEDFLNDIVDSRSAAAARSDKATDDRRHDKVKPLEGDRIATLNQQQELILKNPGEPAQNRGKSKTALLLFVPPIYPSLFGQVRNAFGDRFDQTMGPVPGFGSTVAAAS